VNRDRLEKTLLLSRIALLETIVLRLDICVRALMHDQPPPPQFDEAIQASMEGLEATARAVESAVLRGKFGPLTDAESAMFADEFREVFEQLKARVRALFAD
jgi:hypothetical protein